MFEEYCKHDVAIYGGYLIDEKELLSSASGGIATAMAEKMIDIGGYVAGVSYSGDFRYAEYILINDKAQLHRLKGSKYIETHKNTIYADVKKLIEEGQKVLFIGLPCMVAALYKMIGSRPENLLTCELICHGPTSQKVHEEYINYLERTYGSEIIDFSVRYKKGKWNPSFLYAKFKNGQVFEKPFYETEYGYAFSVFGRESCYSCQFRGNSRKGDIMIGDFWGATEKDKFWNKMGVSVIFAETHKGNEFIKNITNIKLFPTTFEKAVSNNLMVIMPKNKNESRTKFKKLFEEKGLVYASVHSISMRAKIIRLIKRIIPNSLVSFAKGVYHTLKR